MNQDLKRHKRRLYISKDAVTWHGQKNLSRILTLDSNQGGCLLGDLLDQATKLTLALRSQKGRSVDWKFLHLFHTRFSQVQKRQENSLNTESKDRQKRKIDSDQGGRLFGRSTGTGNKTQIGTSFPKGRSVDRQSLQSLTLGFRRLICCRKHPQKQEINPPSEGAGQQ